MKAARYLWASPASLLGVFAGLCLLPCAAQLRRHTGVLEITLRNTTWLPFVVITLGHVVIATSQHHQEQLRSHERGHVRQYETWGALLLIAYPAESLWQLLRGRRPYLDNRFEVQACRHAELARTTLPR